MSGEAKNMYNEYPEYNLTDLRTPVLSGLPLRLMVSAVNSLGPLAKKILEDSNGFCLRDLVNPERQTYEPVWHVQPLTTIEDHTNPNAVLKSLSDSFGDEQRKTKGFSFTTIMDYHNAFKSGAITPTDVATQFIETVQKCNGHNMNIFISLNEADLLNQASASTERYASGNYLSVLDGVPVVAKDCTDVKGYVSTHGVKSMKHVADEDSQCNANIRAAGGILAGKTNMHPLGMGVTGCNIDYGYPVNPYKPGYFTGGSSSGTAAAVAVGLCPFGVGTDGGGSVRMPAALCGVVGLKATYGRISPRGSPNMPHLGSQAVGHTGPLSGCVTDCAIAYSVMAGPDRRMSNTWAQPRVEIVGYNNTEALRGKRLGVYRPFFEHCDDQIAKSCNETVQKLVQNYGCEVVEIRIPRLDELKTAHFITICTESLLGTHQMKPEDQGNLQPSVRSVFGLAKNFTADDVARAMRLRTYFMKYMNEHVFTECDVVVTPTTGEVAGPVLGYPHGEDILDGELTGRIMRFAQIGNFTGIPAITVPASYTDEGLPIGIQFMSKWWDELTLFQMASAVEIECEKRKPELYMPVLKQ